ncbi:hypothetical protein ACFFGU_04670, partial [Azotobacter chroococcum]
HANRPLPDFRGILRCCLHGSILSKVGASEKPGAVHWLESEGKWGVQGDPLEFAKHERAAAPAAK